jgi:Ribonuclease G/E
MSGRRRLYLDDGPGEARGVVTLDGLPERLLIRRVTDRVEHQPGARLVGRVRRIEKSLATAFVDVGAPPDGVLALTGDAAKLSEGSRIEVEVASPPRQDKGAVLRLLGGGEGGPRLIAPAPELEAELTAFAPGEPIVSGRDARQAADEAEDAALAVGHPLPGGGSLSIEPTAALVAIDVDVGRTPGDPRRAARRANREAITAAARLLRLKGLGGPVVFDLAGKGRDGDALKATAGTAFAPEGDGVVFGPITRFGLWPMTLPRLAAPLAERLCDRGGSPTVATLAFRLLRAVEAAAGPGQRVEAGAAPIVAEMALALSPVLLERIGPRFLIHTDPSLRPDQFKVASL